jgi:hypothetical protein
VGEGIDDLQPFEAAEFAKAIAAELDDVVELGGLSTAGDERRPGTHKRMKRSNKFFPFNAEQTINILSEFGPLITMFVVNAASGHQRRHHGAAGDDGDRHRRHVLHVSPAADVSADRLDRDRYFRSA